MDLVRERRPAPPITDLWPALFHGSSRGACPQLIHAQGRTHFAGDVQEDFRGYEEPHEIQVVLDGAEPYLPALGGKRRNGRERRQGRLFAHKGLDGVIDISPFTCMNGIVGEAVYPRISRDHAGIPIRNFYFDGTNSDLDRDIGIFLELARSYQRHKPWRREMPAIAKAATP